MTKINHRRKNKLPVALRHGTYDNGYSIATLHNVGESKPSKHEIENTDPKESFQRVGKTRQLDKSMHSWGNRSEFADKHIAAGIGNDFCNGHRGMAKAVKGAKKYVRSRTRFHEKAKLRSLISIEECE